MWPQFLLCFLVGLSFASQESPAWKENTEYTYEVRGRSLAGLQDVSNEYTGIVLRAKLVVQPQAGDKLRCKIIQPEYAEVQTNLPDGWMSKLPDSQLGYQALEMTNKPFDVVLKNGVVRELIVEQEVPEWEANIIKSFVSQLQLDTRAENLVEYQANILPKDESNNAVFKTLEDTVTGITETNYDIHPLPEYILQSEPHLAPFPHLKGDGSIIEIVKSKNFTNGYDLPSYYFGLGDAGKWEPQSNQFGQILQRHSLGRAIVTGTLQKYTVQYSETTNQIMVSPSREYQQKGSVNSMMRIKLTNADQQNNQLPELQSPVRLGSLVYSYSNQEGVNKVRPGRIFQREQYQRESNNQQYSKDINEGTEDRSNYFHKRHPRSLTRQMRENIYESSEESIESQEDWTQPKPKLSDYPKSPMLPFTTGYKGASIKYSSNMQIVDKVCRLSLQIGEEIEKAQEIPEKHTLAKFVVLTSVLRILNESELKQAAQRLYSQETEGAKYFAWTVFRDAVAETGTGPAFLMIKDLIETKKIRGNEASEVILIMGQAVREPTEEYIRSFYELVKKQLSTQQQEQTMLNETMLFTFSNLVSQVYVDKHVSHREYPTHSFGKFYTRAGRNFVRKEFIPYLAKQLREAVTQGHALQIHAYIRALGILGDSEIMYTFEPYLEGKVPCSQFQRFLMVVALHKAARIHPQLVGPVLYRLYQNVGENTEIRVAAVYMLMHTNPSSEMLQRMAMYTNLEANHKVCAAVKSAIEYATDLKGLEFAELRASAQSAKPFLSKKNFGVQHPLDLLYSYASENWESYYKNVLQTIVGEESGIVSSFYYAMEGQKSGYKYRYLSVESVVSDIRNAFHVFEHQTEWYKQQQTKQKTTRQTEKSIWGSHNIARMLNMQTEELEQLEGGMFLQILDWQKHLIFNNHSLERLPQLLEEVERTLAEGKKITYTKLINNYESAIAFPTEMGLPFLYTYDLPALVKVQGTLKARAEPKISSSNKMTTPDKVEMECELKILLSGKKHTEFGVFTPFNHQHYSAGYDQNIQVHLPIKAKINVDFRKPNVEYELEPLEHDRKVNIFHKSSWPYTSKHDILALQPTAGRKNTHIIRRRIQNQWERTIGDKTVGMAFRVKYENDDRYPAIESLAKGYIFNSHIQYEQMNVELVPEQSSNMKLKINLAYERKEQKEYVQESSEKALLDKLAKMPEETNERISQLGQHASVGIHDAIVHVFDSRIEFSGKQNVEFTGTLAYAANQGYDSRFLIYVKKQSQIPRSRPFEGGLVAKFRSARTNGLDMEYLMKKYDPTSKVEIKMAFAEKLPTNNQIDIDAEFRRSDSRKEYIMELPVYHKCQREMQQGNKQLLACAITSQMAGLQDIVKFEIKYPNMRPKDLNSILQAYNSIDFCPNFEIEDNREPKQKQGEVSVKVHFYPDWKRVNVSVSSQEVYAQIRNIQVNDYAKRVFVAHPSFDVIDRLEGKLSGLETYKPICSLDKTEAYTFDGADYPLTLNNFWTVLLQYVPLRSAEHAQSSVEEQLKHELETYTVLARKSNQGSDLKEIKIVVSTPRTEQKILEVDMKPRSGGNYPNVYIDGKQISIPASGRFVTYQREVTVGSLPNGEMYVEVHNAFYVIYDGTRAKITSQSMKLRNRVRGICGNFDGRKADDFVTPSNCVVREPAEFIASYTVLKDGEKNQEILDLKSRSQKNHCVHKKIPLYVNYISEKTNRDQYQPTGSCSKYQTRYVMENGQICFTVKPLTICKNGCQQTASLFKNVDVHCVENKNVAVLWKSQIDKGASPDFSQKPVTKSIQMEVPQSCRSL